MQPIKDHCNMVVAIVTQQIMSHVFVFMISIAYSVIPNDVRWKIRMHRLSDVDQINL